MALKDLPPVPVELPQQRWFHLLYARIMSTSAGAFLFSALDFTGSNITSIVTRNHNDLTTVQGGAVGDKQHLTTQELQSVDSSQVMNWIN